jgi:glycosyltransferase involved in cell wall biosynthesis
MLATLGIYHRASTDGDLQRVEMVARASGDLSIFPGLAETFENLVREAMAGGLPVVALGDAAAPSLIDPWRNGFTLHMGYRASIIAAGCKVARDIGRLGQPGNEARNAAEGIS